LPVMRFFRFHPKSPQPTRMGVGGRSMFGHAW